jgi:hypothetical protein
LWRLARQGEEEDINQNFARSFGHPLTVDMLTLVSKIIRWS